MEPAIFFSANTENEEAGWRGFTSNEPETRHVTIFKAVGCLHSLFISLSLLQRARAIFWHAPRRLISPDARSVNFCDQLNYPGKLPTSSLPVSLGDATTDSYGCINLRSIEDWSIKPGNTQGMISDFRAVARFNGTTMNDITSLYIPVQVYWDTSRKSKLYKRLGHYENHIITKQIVSCIYWSRSSIAVFMNIYTRSTFYDPIYHIVL